MNADNMLYIIGKEEYELSEFNASTGKQIGGIIYKDKDLKKVIKKAEDYQKENIVEYGIHFNI